MNADFIETQLVAYVSLREALGFQMRAEKVLLPEFVAFVKAHGSTDPIRTEIALAWACQASAHRGPSGAARRLSIARGFLLYLQASAPETEVPAPGLLPAPRRPQPYLFTPTQLTALFEVAQTSRPRGSLRPHTLSTLLGLLASTGLRVGEAIRLQIDQVKLDLQPPHLHIRETKFHKARLVPLHPTTTERLRDYQAQRAHLQYDGRPPRPEGRGFHAPGWLRCGPCGATPFPPRPERRGSSGVLDGLSDTFFVSEQGHHLQYLALHNWFARLCQRLAIGPTDGGRAPCLMSFRHTFAVTCLQRWYQQGQDVQALLPHLSVYLGHVDPHESYWYLTAVPALLSAAAQRFQTYAQVGGTPDAE